MPNVGDADRGEQRSVVDRAVLAGEVQQSDLDRVEAPLAAEDQGDQQVVPDEEELHDRDRDDRRCASSGSRSRRTSAIIDAPSIVAASKISRGIARKYVAIMNTVSGSPAAV